MEYITIMHWNTYTKMQLDTLQLYNDIHYNNTLELQLCNGMHYNNAIEYITKMQWNTLQ